MCDVILNEVKDLVLERRSGNIRLFTAFRVTLQIIVVPARIKGESF